MLFAAVIRVGDQRVDENAALGCTNQRALHFAAIESEDEDFDAGLRSVDRTDEWCHTIARLHEQLHVLGSARYTPIWKERCSSTFHVEDSTATCGLHRVDGFDIGRR